MYWELFLADGDTIKTPLFKPGDTILPRIIFSRIIFSRTYSPPPGMERAAAVGPHPGKIVGKMGQKTHFLPKSILTFTNVFIMIPGF